MDIPVDELRNFNIPLGQLRDIIDKLITQHGPNAFIFTEAENVFDDISIYIDVGAD